MLCSVPGDPWDDIPKFRRVTIGQYVLPIRAPMDIPETDDGYFTIWPVVDGGPLDRGQLVCEISTKNPADRRSQLRFSVFSPGSGFLDAHIRPQDKDIKPGAILAYVTSRENDMEYTVEVPSGDPEPRQSTSATPVRQPPVEIQSALAGPTTDDRGVFISYRRSDQAAFAGRLYDRLTAAFDKATVFMDVDSIDLGLDFVDVLHEALGRCRVLIVVIGRSWLSATDELGAPRLENPDDFVRLEVEVALERGLRVIPVLVDGAAMPRATGLPESIAKLARRNGREISNARFGSDTIELINTLRLILDRSP
jgi:TIR domain